MRYVDVHTHMLDRQWLKMLKEKGGPRYSVEPLTDEVEGIYKHGAHFMTPMPGHFDYDLRVRDMDEAGVDLAIVSLTCPNVFWGDESSSCEAARIVNDAMVEGQRKHPTRIRWFLSLPWEYPGEAVKELDRAHDNGAVGVMVLANVAGRHLTEEAFQPIWKAIRRQGSCGAGTSCRSAGGRRNAALRAFANGYGGIHVRHHAGHYPYGSFPASSIAMPI